MYPRRVKDLPRFEADSDDEYRTPLKQNQKKNAEMDHQDQTDCNKENKDSSCNTKNNSAVNNSGTFNKLRMYPKRSSELPALESDSEEDDNNLNCAILNDSFRISPTKSEHNDSCSTTSPDALREKHSRKIKNADKNESNAENLSFLTRFNEMALSTDSNDKESIKLREPNGTTTKLSQIKHTNKSAKEIKSTRVSFSSQSSIKESTNFAQIQRFNSDPTPQQQKQPQQSLHPTRENLETPFKPVTNSTATSEAQFVTPQVQMRTFSLQRRPTEQKTEQKTRSAIDNEFRSQKVLFQTPMAMTRACLPNDSITLSLCDSINERVTPKTNEKTPQIVEDNAKSKKSLAVAFQESENERKVSLVESSAATDMPLSSSTSSTTSVTKVTNATTSAIPTKETILEINNAKYAIIKKLGAGGSSSVYLAQRKDSGKECALKIVDLHGDAAVVEGYLNETKLLAKLQGNACVVSLYEYELLQKESKLYMVMEKGDSDLNKILQNYKTNLPLYVLMNYWYQMLQAVNYIHQNGVIHSDLKPANFLMINGRLKLIDFGIASNIALDSTSIIKFSQAGTFNYISPEALTDTSTGNSPFKSQPKIKMVKKCLQHNPKQRPSCAELLQYPFNMVIPIQNLTVPQK